MVSKNNWKRKKLRGLKRLPTYSRKRREAYVEQKCKHAIRVGTRNSKSCEKVVPHDRQWGCSCGTTLSGVRTVGTQVPHLQMYPQRATLFQHSLATDTANHVVPQDPIMRVHDVVELATICRTLPYNYEMRGMLRHTLDDWKQRIRLKQHTCVTVDPDRLLSQINFSRNWTSARNSNATRCIATPNESGKV